MGDHSIMNFDNFKSYWDSLEEKDRSKVREYVVIFMDFRRHIDLRDSKDSFKTVEGINNFRFKYEKELGGDSEDFFTTLSIKLATALLRVGDFNSQNDYFKFVVKEILKQQEETHV